MNTLEYRPKVGLFLNQQIIAKVEFFQTIEVLKSYRSLNLL